MPCKTQSHLYKTDIKLVVADLDGTLLNQEHKFSTTTQKSINTLVEEGYQFMVATGRHYQDVYLLAEQLAVEVTLITSNGARVHDHHGKCLYENHMPAHLVEQVLSLSQGFKVHRNLYQDDLWLVEEPNEALLAIHDASGFRYQLTDFSSVNLEHVDKIYFTADHSHLLELETTLKAKLNEQLNITFTSPEYLEVMNLGVNKGQALQRLLHQRQISAANVMVFGDGMNDIEMLKLAKYGVVMNNASDSVKQALPELPVTKSNAEDGVADYLFKTLLK